MSAPKPRRVEHPFDELDLSHIRAHVLAMHPGIFPQPRDHRDLSWAHGRDHDRHASATHVHAGPDSPVIYAGDLVPQERPEGWYTGRGAIDRRTWDRLQAEAARRRFIDRGRDGAS